MSVLFVQEHEHLLRQVFGGVPRYMRCRERHNPFTQLGENLFARHRFTGYGNHNIDAERGRSVAGVTRGHNTFNPNHSANDRNSADSASATAAVFRFSNHVPTTRKTPLARSAFRSTRATRSSPNRKGRT